MAGPPKFDIELPPFRAEPTPRWVRVKVGDEWVADSHRAQLAVWFGPGRLPTYFFPEEDVRSDVFRPSDASADPALADHDIEAGGDTIRAGARLMVDPPPPLAAVRGHWTFSWRDERVAWFEEALQVHVHARDPNKRVDVVPSERHVHVLIDGETVADSRRPHALFETSLPTRWYFPSEDVRLDMLEPSELVTRCPYKGTARFWSVKVGGELYPDIAWSYPEPVPECPRIAGLIAFFNERVDLVVDGEPQKRPFTPWSLSAAG